MWGIAVCGDRGVPIRPSGPLGSRRAAWSRIGERSGLRGLHDRDDAAVWYFDEFKECGGVGGCCRGCFREQKLKTGVAGRGIVLSRPIVFVLMVVMLVVGVVVVAVFREASVIVAGSARRDGERIALLVRVIGFEVNTASETRSEAERHKEQANDESSNLRGPFKDHGNGGLDSHWASTEKAISVGAYQDRDSVSTRIRGPPFENQ